MKKIQIIGYIGADAKCENFGGKKAICFNVGVSQGKEEKRTTEWFSCVLMRENMEIGEMLTKGNIIFVEGNFYTKEWRNEGAKKQQICINVGGFQVFNNKKN